MTIKNICSSWLFGNVSVCNRNWRNAHFVEKSCDITNIYTSLVYGIENKSWFNFILEGWRPSPPPSPPPPPVRQCRHYTPPRKITESESFSGLLKPPPLSLSLSLSLTHGAPANLLYIYITMQADTYKQHQNIYCALQVKNKVDNLVLAFLLYSCGGDVVVVVLILLFAG